ncbi:TPA: hypothetical protein ACTW38_002908 [Klebsiella michiganensis]
MAKKKPLPAAARSAIRRLAAAFVCAELELQVVAKFVEEKTGKPYDHNASDSYLNSFLDSDPEVRRVWELMQKDIVSTRKDFADRLGRDRDC